MTVEVYLERKQQSTWREITDHGDICRAHSRGHRTTDNRDNRTPAEDMSNHDTKRTLGGMEAADESDDGISRQLGDEPEICRYWKFCETVSEESLEKRYAGQSRRGEIEY